MLKEIKYTVIRNFFYKLMWSSRKPAECVTESDQLIVFLTITLYHCFSYQKNEWMNKIKWKLTCHLHSQYHTIHTWLNTVPVKHWSPINDVCWLHWSEQSRLSKCQKLSLQLPTGAKCNIRHVLYLIIPNEIGSDHRAAGWTSHEPPSMPRPSL